MSDSFSKYIKRIYLKYIKKEVLKIERDTYSKEADILKKLLGDNFPRFSYSCQDISYQNLKILKKYKERREIENKRDQEILEYYNRAEEGHMLRLSYFNYDKNRYAQAELTNLGKFIVETELKKLEIVNKYDRLTEKIRECDDKIESIDRQIKQMEI